MSEIDKTFEEELEFIINKHSKENDSDTPDFILAEYLRDCLTGFSKATRRRSKWYSKDTPDDEHLYPEPDDEPEDEKLDLLSQWLYMLNDKVVCKPAPEYKDWFLKLMDDTRTLLDKAQDTQPDSMEQIGRHIKEKVIAPLLDTQPEWCTCRFAKEVEGSDLCQICGKRSKLEDTQQYCSCDEKPQVVTNTSYGCVCLECNKLIKPKEDKAQDKPNDGECRCDEPKRNWYFTRRCENCYKFITPPQKPDVPEPFIVPIDDISWTDEMILVHRKINEIIQYLKEVR